MKNVMNKDVTFFVSYLSLSVFVFSVQKGFLHKYQRLVTFIVDSDMQSVYPIISKTLIMCFPMPTFVSYLSISVFVPKTFFGSKRLIIIISDYKVVLSLLFFTKTPSIIFYCLKQRKMRKL